jgi:hypothetical protein
MTIDASTTFYLAAPSLSDQHIYAAGTSLDIYFSDLEEVLQKQKRIEDLEGMQYIKHRGDTYKVEGLLKHTEGTRLGSVWVYVTPYVKELVS